VTTLDDRRFMGYGPRPEGFFPLTKAVLDPEKLPPVLTGLFPPVLAAAKEPFKGITTDGVVVPDLFTLQDEGFDSRGAVAAARGFLSLLSAEQQAAVRFDIDAEQWRWWINAFPLWEPHGLFLDDLDPARRTAALDVVQACLSAKGFADTCAAMRLNGALGELIGQYPDTLREYAYFLAMYGDPSADGPWGWQLWGHHLDVHCFVLGGQIVLTPTFIGAEPVIADRGRYAGTRLFDAERAAGLALRRSLSAAQESAAVLHRSILSTDLPPGKVNFVDGRHQGGAGRDNRVIPYEGIPASDLSPGQRDLLADLVGTYAARLPGAPAAALAERFRAYQDQAHLAWIGGAGDNDAFYYKVHSPVLLIEFDCHQGVFLDNEEPEPFHVHTIVRTPNGGDYGRDLLRQHYARHHR
jgi:Protein of unknown function (DUF3500)